MQNVCDVIDLISQEIKTLDAKITEHKGIELQITNLESDISKKEENIILLEEFRAIFIESAKVMRDKAKAHFEKIITDALQFISQDSAYKFVIEESIVRGKPAYEFYIESMVNGEICKKKPEDSCGGGFIDIIAITAKVAYLQIFNNPKIMNACFIMDEPCKMVSEQMSVKAAEYIKFLGKQFGLQIIMVTHNENIAAIADKTFVVTKNRNGISSASPIIDLSVSNIAEDINDILIKEETNE